MTDEMKALAWDSKLLRAVCAEVINVADVAWKSSQEPDISSTEELSRQAKALGMTDAVMMMREMLRGEYDG